jgi:hypothetical protein
MTPTIDRSALRSAISAAPPEVKVPVAAIFRDKGWPSLAPEAEWEPEALWDAANAIVGAAEAAGVTMKVPVDTSVLRDRIMALPDDLADYAAAEAVPLGIPNVGHPGKWTLKNWTDADKLLAHAEDLAVRRRRHVMSALGQAGELADDDRHALVRSLTGGRSESIKKLTGPEARHLAAWAEAKILGMAPEAPGPFVPDWKAEAKFLGTTQGALLKDAKEWAKGRRMTPPKKLEEVTDHRMVAALLMTANDGRTVLTEAADATEEATVSPWVAGVIAAAVEEPEEPATPEPEPEVDADGHVPVTIAVAPFLKKPEELAKMTEPEPESEGAKLITLLREYDAARLALEEHLTKLGVSFVRTR